MTKTRVSKGPRINSGYERHNGHYVNGTDLAGQDAEIARAKEAATHRNVGDVALTEGDVDLLAEIDTILEDNAAEFVANYVQKGGE